MIRATRSGAAGTVTFKDAGPQYGAFHPGGDDSIIIPIAKWDTNVLWEVPCDKCGLPVWVGRGTSEVLGNYHSGCFGYPACACRRQHQGECTKATREAP